MDQGLKLSLPINTKTAAKTAEDNDTHHLKHLHLAEDPQAELAQLLKLPELEVKTVR